MNAFLLLGLAETLALSETALSAAFRQAGRVHHPDEGGSEKEFSQIGQAYQILRSPSKRLKHWLELRDIRGEPRGVVDGVLLDWFGVVGQTLQSIDEVLRKKDQAQSHLARALLENEVQHCREKIDSLQASLELLMSEKMAHFVEIEHGPIAADEAWILVRDLAFLEKWQAQLRERYGRCF